MLLELFSGTGSVGKAFRARGRAAFSVDIDPAAEPTLVADVLDLQPDALHPLFPCSDAGEGTEGPSGFRRPSPEGLKSYRSLWGPRLVHGKSRERLDENQGGGRRVADASS